MTSLGHGGGRVVAALLVLIALLARELHVSPPRATDTAPIVVEAGSAWRLHRISLAIASPRLAQTDRALSFPGQRDLTQLPVHDELCALAARLALRLPGGGVGELPDPGRLERFLRGLGPLLAALTLLFTYHWLRSREGLAVGAQLAGLALVAFLPGFVELGVPGRISIEALAGWGIVIVVLLMSGVWRGRDSLDRMTSAMLAGGALGIGLSTSPLFLALLVAALAVFALELQATLGEARATVARTALLFWISSALLAQLPSLGGPWVPATEGVIAGWAKFLQLVFLVGVLPLVLGLAASERVLSRRAVAAALGLLGVCLVVVLTRSEAVSALLGAIGSARAPSSTTTRLGVLVGLAFLLAWASRARASWGGEQRFLFLLGVAGLVGAWLEPAAIVLALVPLAYAAARCAESRRGFIVTVVACGGLLLLGVGRVWGGDEPSTADGDVARACRWLRSNSPRPAAWGAATAVRSWGVGIEPDYAPLVVWQARRPAAGLGERLARGAARPALARELRAARDLEGFLASSRAAGLRFWILAPGSVERLGLAPRPSAALEELRLGVLDEPGGAVRVWTSGGDPGRAVSILEL